MQIFYNVKAHLLSSAYSRIAPVTRVIRFSKLKKKKKRKEKAFSSSSSFLFSKKPLKEPRISAHISQRPKKKKKENDCMNKSNHD